MVLRHRGPSEPAERRRWPLPVAAALTAAAIGAGTVVATAGQGGGERAATPVRLTGSVQPVAAGGLSARDVAADQAAFGLELLAHRCTANPAPNDVLSPTSAALALSMLDAGAKGTTQQAVSQLLHLPGWNPQVIAGLHDQHQRLSGLAQLKVSNHIYTQHGVRPEPRVLDDLATSEGADLQTLDFAGHPEQATDAINAQVAADTSGMIKRLFAEPLEPATVTVLTNAIYLDAAWKQAFNPARDAPFHTAGGATVTVPLMESQERAGQIRHAAGWTSITLPYAGNQLQAVVLLPPARAGNCAAPTTGELAALTSGSSTGAQITMPTLHLSQTSDLKGDLAALGLPLAGDYSGFGVGEGISRVVQETVLDVDEHGTKAAAGTGIGAAVSAVVEPQITVDRPYVLLLQDTATRTPLFLARIGDPRG